MSTVNNDLEILRLQKIIEEKNLEIARLTENKPEKNINFVVRNKTVSSFDSDCDQRYGYELISQWREAKESWCVPNEESEIKSSMTCYPYKQKHKSVPDIFCEAKNFIIDFSGVCYCTT
jgi:hypothetical protein